MYIIRAIAFAPLRFVMLAEVACEDYARCLDELVDEVLSAAGVVAPPIDAAAVAQRLGIAVARDDRQLGRARCVRLQTPHSQRPLIFVRGEPRVERGQWSIAHEIGEHISSQVFERLNVDPLEAAAGARERVANLLASRLLLPTRQFLSAAALHAWDLLALKEHFRTASHELIARRMLEFEPPVVISIFDHGRLTFRRANLPGGAPQLSDHERSCRQRAASTNRPARLRTSRLDVSAWPIHEPGWQREIVRMEAKTED